MSTERTERLMSKPGLLIAGCYLIAGWVVVCAAGRALWWLGAPMGAAVAGAVLLGLLGAAGALLRGRRAGRTPGRACHGDAD